MEIEDRLRRVGDELSRAADVYGQHTRSQAYVGPERSIVARRPSPVVVMTVGLLAALAVAIASQLPRGMTSVDTAANPTGTAIETAVAATLGEGWLWPSSQSGVATDSATSVATQFAELVLGLTEFEIVDAPSPLHIGPAFLRIQTAKLRLGVLVAPQGREGAWVVHQLNTSGMSQFPYTALEVSPPAGAERADVLLRYATQAEVLQISLSDSAAVMRVPISEWVTTAIVVFRDSDGDVIDARGGDFGPLDLHAAGRPSATLPSPGPPTTRAASQPSVDSAPR